MMNFTSILLCADVGQGMRGLHAIFSSLPETSVILVGDPLVTAVLRQSLDVKVLCLDPTQGIDMEIVREFLGDSLALVVPQISLDEVHGLQVAAKWLEENPDADEVRSLIFTSDGHIESFSYDLVLAKGQNVSLLPIELGEKFWLKHGFFAATKVGYSGSVALMRPERLVAAHLAAGLPITRVAPLTEESEIYVHSGLACFVREALSELNPRNQTTFHVDVKLAEEWQQVAVSHLHIIHRGTLWIDELERRAVFVSNRLIRTVDDKIRGEAVDGRFYFSNPGSRLQLGEGFERLLSRADLLTSNRSPDAHRQLSSEELLVLNFARAIASRLPHSVLMIARKMLTAVVRL